MKWLAIALGVVIAILQYRLWLSDSGVRELARIWRALTRSDARVIVVRAATPAVGVAALHCRLHRRALVFSSSNDSNFAPSGARYDPNVRSTPLGRSRRHPSIASTPMQSCNAGSADG